MRIDIEIGALSPSLSSQLGDMVSPEDAAALDKDNMAITRCYVRGLIGYASTTTARKRLLKDCQKAVDSRSKSKASKAK